MFNSFMADTQDVQYGLGRHTYIYIMTIVLRIANRRFTVHQVQESGIYRDQGIYLTIGWRRRRESMSNIIGRKWETRCILTFNPKNKEKPRESMEPLENSIQKSIAKYPASKSRKRDVAKTTNQKNILEVAGCSIVVMEDIVIAT